MYFITGLARSRTAWFSAYLGIAHDTWPPEASCAGCGAWTYYDDFPTARWVFIRRDPEEAARALHAHRPDLDFDRCLELNLCWDRDMDALRGLHVPFEEVDSRLLEIHEFIGVPYDEVRASLFKGFRVMLI